MGIWWVCKHCFWLCYQASVMIHFYKQNLVKNKRKVAELLTVPPPWWGNNEDKDFLPSGHCAFMSQQGSEKTSVLAPPEPAALCCLQHCPSSLLRTTPGRGSHHQLPDQPGTAPVSTYPVLALSQWWCVALNFVHQNVTRENDKAAKTIEVAGSSFRLSRNQTEATETVGWRCVPPGKKGVLLLELDKLPRTKDKHTCVTSVRLITWVSKFQQRTGDPMANKVRVPQHDLVECPGKCSSESRAWGGLSCSSCQAISCLLGLNTAQNSNLSSLITERREEEGKIEGREEEGKGEKRHSTARLCGLLLNIDFDSFVLVERLLGGGRV